ncbi:MAG TPA: citrate/2-methylcitrate synthase [Candidatus Paceibacterota bacterium]|nr:citrate/2-methylcitrate synthase [Candidatus Paceibacterota bacterium]
MISLNDIRKKEQKTLVLGNHPGIVQSILDFDYACGKREPSILACITSNRKAIKFFFGNGEVMIPCYPTVTALPSPIASRVNWMLNVQSGRRAFDSTVAFFDAFPEAHGGHIFAENVPERHATELIKRYGKTKTIAGPSGVGILVGGHLKIGAIGGIGLAQLEQGKLATAGSVAVVSTSGGMTNELITAVSQAGKRVSFSISIGGERFPISSLTDVLTLAENDPATKAIVYFGELGGVDEYEIVEMITSRALTKPVLAYIAGVIDEAFDEHMQFGHAKALVTHADESARAKRDALRAAGALAPDTFPEFLEELARLETPGFHPPDSPSGEAGDTVVPMDDLSNRRASILSTRDVVDLDEIPVFVKNKKPLKADTTFAQRALEAIIGRNITSDITASFAEAVFSLLIDHGGQVSGAVNTMITARAGKDLVSSLAAGLLTIGPRFGGAVNEAARTWLLGVHSQKDAAAFVEEQTKGGKLLSGIGHRKYRVGLPDPRVAALSEFATLLKKHPHYDFAREVEKVTTGKNGTLILNVDGAMAALFLDILAECEGLSREELHELIDAEFFNALFVIPRSVGFIAHFIEQKKNDEGLFRLPDELLFVRKKKN